MKRLRIRVGEKWYDVEVEDLSTSPVTVMVDGQPVLVEVEGLPRAKNPGLAGSSAAPASGSKAKRTAPAETAFEKLLRSPMPGRVLAVTVKPGQKVSAGQEVCIIESMKMEQTIRVSRDGKIKKVPIKPGQQVNSGDLLVELE